MEKIFMLEMVDTGGVVQDTSQRMRLSLVPGPFVRHKLERLAPY